MHHRCLVALFIYPGATRIDVPAIIASTLVVPGTQTSVAAAVQLEVTGKVFGTSFPAQTCRSERSRLRQRHDDPEMAAEISNQIFIPSQWRQRTSIVYRDTALAKMSSSEEI